MNNYKIIIKDTVADKVINENNKPRIYNHETHKIKVSLDNKYNEIYRNSIRWDFGDGTIINAPTALHFYNKAGHYIISATLYNIDGSIGQHLTSEIEVKNIFPLLLSFKDPASWIDKKCFVSKNNKLGQLCITIDNEVISKPAINPIRRWDSTPAEKSYFDIKDEPMYHLKKYFCFLDKDLNYNIDGKIGKLILRPTKQYIPNYIDVYGRVIYDNNEIIVEAYSKEEAGSYYITSDVNDNYQEIIIKKYNFSDELPENCSIIGKIANVDIFYKNDNICNNELIFEIDKKTLKFKNEESLSENYTNIPPLGITKEIYDIDDIKDSLRIVLNSNGICSNLNDNDTISVEEHLKHNFYKNYKIQAYYGYYILNDSCNGNDETYNLVKSDSVRFDNKITGDKIIINLDNTNISNYYQKYFLTPLENKFIIKIDDNIFYEHDELIDLNEFIIPKEKQTPINVETLLDVYMPHPMFNESVNLKKFLTDIFKQKNMLSYIISKGDNFLNDYSNHNTCYLDSLLSILEMTDNPEVKYKIDALDKISDLKELTRILSMSYSDLFGNIINDDFDIKIQNGYYGKNVSDKLDPHDSLYCNENYEMIGFKRNKTVYKLVTPAPYIIIKDDFTSKTRIGSFYKLESMQFEDFSDLSDDWKSENIDFINEIKYVYRFEDYTYNWGWGLNLPEEYEKKVDKASIIDNYYSFYIFRPSASHKRKYNFINEDTLPLKEGKQLSVEEWEKDFGFTYDCLMKVLIDNLEI